MRRANVPEVNRAPGEAAGQLAVLDSLPHLVSLWDRERRCVFANTPAAAASGMTPQRMRGMTQVEVLGRHAVELVERNIAAALRGESTVTDQVLLDGDGGLRHFQVSYTPNQVRAEVVGYSTLWVDVTPQLHLLAAVARDSARVARLLERQRLTALAGNEVLDQLDHLAAALDTSQDGPDCEGLVDTLAGAIAQLREAAEVAGSLGVPRPRGGEASLVVVDLDHERELAQPPERDAWYAPATQGRLDRVVEPVAALLDELPVLITEWGPDRELRYVNRAASSLLRQWRPGAAVGDRLGEIADALFVAAIEPYVEAALAGEAQSYSRRERTPEGEWLHFHVRYVPRILDGAVVGVYAYATDVSLRMEAAKALSAARAEHATLRERQAIHDHLHAAVLQEMFGAKLALEMAARSTPNADRLAAARVSITSAADSLRSLLATS